MIKPNLFLAGAPKCGTTALYVYLREHPQIFLSDPKEPNYWAFDMPGAKSGKYIPVDTWKQYLAIFERATDSHLWVGEASTNYLFSEVAIKEIISFNSNARIIVCVRNPLKLLPSYHATLVHAFEENEPDFEKAWNLQGKRSSGVSIPAKCRAPQGLQYKKMGLLGAQIERLFKLVPVDQRLVIVFDDLIADPKSVYEKILVFLGVESDERTDFQNINQRVSHRFPAISRIIRHPPKWINYPVQLLRRLGSSEDYAWSPIKMAKAALLKRSSTQSLSLDFRNFLIQEFRDDVELLSILLNRDFSHWLDNK